jgi:hypothetical protein
VTKIPPAGVLLRVPVIGQFDLGGVITRRTQKHQREPAPGNFLAALLHQPKLVAIKIEGLIEVADPYHGMEVFHRQTPGVNM